MRRIVFRLGMFEGDRPYSERALALLVRALVEADVAYLRAHPRTPALREAGVRPDGARSRCPRAGDEWHGIDAILASGVANSVSLAAWRCAERIVRGERVEPLVRWVPSDGGGVYHVVLAGEDGALEDPSGIVFERAGGAPLSVTAARHDMHVPASRVALNLHLFRSERERRYSERVLSILLGALTAADVLYLRARSEAPLLYHAGVRYRAERFPREEWKGVGALHEDGEGDCEDLACARSAELIVRGVPARPVFRWRRLGRLSVYHILVRHPDGALEDPSLVLGMGERGATLADLGVDEARAPRARGARSRAHGERTSWERC